MPWIELETPKPTPPVPSTGVEIGVRSTPGNHTITIIQMSAEFLSKAGLVPGNHVSVEFGTDENEGKVRIKVDMNSEFQIKTATISGNFTKNKGPRPTKNVLNLGRVPQHQKLETNRFQDCQWTIEENYIILTLPIFRSKKPAPTGTVARPESIPISPLSTGLLGKHDPVARERERLEREKNEYNPALAGKGLPKPPVHQSAAQKRLHAQFNAPVRTTVNMGDPPPGRAGRVPPIDSELANDDTSDLGDE